MPIFEYVCTSCDHRFEAIVRGAEQPHCPSCDGDHLEKQLSVFAVGSSGATSAARSFGPAPCGTCGDPRGPGSCSIN
jgi:putative FmdB family regulatory protein